jgi:transposase
MYPFLVKLFADAGYQGPQFATAVAEVLPDLSIEIVKRSDHPNGFVVLPMRWVVERTLAWLNRCRRLAKYVTTCERDTFLREAQRADHPVRILCMTLAYAGCRPAEALALTADRIDLAAGVLVLETLKKRQAGSSMQCPYPLPCSMCSTWCTASANCSPAAARAAGCACGPGRA